MVATSRLSATWKAVGWVPLANVYDVLGAEVDTFPREARTDAAATTKPNKVFVNMFAVQFNWQNEKNGFLFRKFYSAWNFI